MIVTDRDLNQELTKFKNIISFYSEIRQEMVDSHCEIIWDNNLGEGLERHPTADYGASEDNPEKQEIIAQQRLSSNMISPWINNSPTTDDKRKLR